MFQVSIDFFNGQTISRPYYWLHSSPIVVMWIAFALLKKRPRLRLAKILNWSSEVNDNSDCFKYIFIFELQKHLWAFLLDAFGCPIAALLTAFRFRKTPCAEFCKATKIQFQSTFSNFFLFRFHSLTPGACSQWSNFFSSFECIP